MSAWCGSSRRHSVHFAAPTATPDCVGMQQQSTQQPSDSFPTLCPALPPARPNTTLFCGDLPPYWASGDLLNFFSEFGEVLEARVIGSQVGTHAECQNKPLAAVRTAAGLFSCIVSQTGVAGCCPVPHLPFIPSPPLPAAPRHACTAVLWVCAVCAPGGRGGRAGVCAAAGHVGRRAHAAHQLGAGQHARLEGEKLLPNGAV